MKQFTFTILLMVTLCFSGCGTTGRKTEVDARPSEIDVKTVAELQVDDNITINASADDDSVLDRQDTRLSQHIDDDMTLFTPEDIVLLDNIRLQDWFYAEDASWMLRFKDDLLIIGQENGQVTDVLKYQITSIDHDDVQMIIHIIERINEHSQINETSLELSYYCELVVTGDELVYKNRINDPDLMTETVWLRGK